MQRPGSIPPCRRTLSFGRSLTSPSRTSRPRADRPGLYAAGTCARARLGKMRVHDAPLAGLLAEHHGGAGDEFVAAVMDILRRRLLAGPVALGATMAPNHRHLVGHDPADIERRPVARVHIPSVEFPQPEPVVSSLIRVPVEIEEQRLRRLAPDRIEHVPVEAGIGVDIIGMQLENLLAVALRTADEISLGHRFFPFNPCAPSAVPPGTALHDPAARQSMLPAQDLA